jgi:hypothetical protein
MTQAHLEPFKTWVVHQGYIIHPTPRKAIYEVLRLEEYNPNGNSPHLVFYQRTHDGKGLDAKNRGNVTHLTVPGDAVKLVHRFLNSDANPSKKAQKRRQRDENQRGVLRIVGGTDVTNGS